MKNHHIIIEPGTENSNYWKDIWNYKGLLYFLAWRDILVRYKQTAIGVLWSVLRPLITLFVMWFIGWLFNSNVPEGIPRILLVCAATLPWQFFSASFNDVSLSLLVNSNLLTKVYFPRMIVPVSTIIVCMIDFLISFVLLAIIMGVYRFVPDVRILLLPVFLLLALVTSMGLGLYVAALNVRYRDFRFLIPFIIQFGMYVSPIAFSSSDIYSSDKIPTVAKYIYALNPMVGVIDGFRWCILGGSTPFHLNQFLVSCAISIFLLFAGITYFRKMERTFADVI
jgi:lipopolysaccharide transport system permease protein